MANTQKTGSLSQDEVEKDLSHFDVSDDPQDSETSIHGPRLLFVVLSLISATFLWGLDGTIVADIQATFVDDFQAIDKLAWNSVAFFLGAAATILSWGQVYTRFDAKWVFIFCVLVFEIGSAVCGAAPSESALIAGRAICGVGGAGMYNGVLTLLSLLTEERKRALYMGIPGITWGIGTVLGPVIGGAFALHATWRWGFYINLCVGAACAPVYVFLIPSMDLEKGSPMKHRIKCIDWLGVTLLAGAATALIMGICFGGVVYPWNSTRTIALFVVAGVCIVAFGLQQGLGLLVKYPVFPVDLVKNLSILAIFICETCSATACFLPIYFIPLYFQYVHGASSLKAGIYLLPFICAMVTTVMLCGHLVSKTNNWLPCFFYGGILVTIGGALLKEIDENTSAARVYGLSILVGSGSGAYIQMPFNAAQGFVEPAQIPAAVGLITGAQLAAPAVTLSIANSIFLNKAVAALKPVLPLDAPVLKVVSGVGSAYLQGLDQSTQARALHAIFQSMANVYILIITSGVLTVVTTCFLTFHMRRTAAPGASR